MHPTKLPVWHNLVGSQRSISWFPLCCKPLGFLKLSMNVCNLFRKLLIKNLLAGLMLTQRQKNDWAATQCSIPTRTRRADKHEREIRGKVLCKSIFYAWPLKKFLGHFEMYAIRFGGNHVKQFPSSNPKHNVFLFIKEGIWCSSR